MSRAFFDWLKPGMDSGSGPAKALPAPEWLLWQGQLMQDSQGAAAAIPSARHPRWMCAWAFQMLPGIDDLLSKIN